VLQKVGRELHGSYLVAGVTSHQKKLIFAMLKAQARKLKDYTQN
jgi:hypothetical protein